MKERPRERARLRGLADREGIDMDNIMTATAEVTIDGDGPYPCEVEITQQVEMVISMSATKPDARWSHTDSRGHFHAFTEGGKLPTLRREDVEVTCDGSCGFEGGCEGYTVPKYYCAICDEIVEPRYEPDYEARTVGVPIAGPKFATVTVHTLGVLPEETVSVHVTHQGGEMVGIGDLKLTEWDSERGGRYEVFARFLEPRLT